jgi:hypothetical protein
MDRSAYKPAKMRSEWYARLRLDVQHLRPEIAGVQLIEQRGMPPERRHQCRIEEPPGATT